MHTTTPLCNRTSHLSYSASVDDDSWNTTLAPSSWRQRTQTLRNNTFTDDAASPPPRDWRKEVPACGWAQTPHSSLMSSMMSSEERQARHRVTIDRDLNVLCGSTGTTKPRGGESSGAYYSLPFRDHVQSNYHDSSAGVPPPRPQPLPRGAVASRSPPSRLADDSQEPNVNPQRERVRVDRWTDVAMGGGTQAHSPEPQQTAAPHRDGPPEPQLSSSGSSADMLDEDAPLVPSALLTNLRDRPYLWNAHPCHHIVLMMLQKRGIFLPTYRSLIDYHMAELFLHYLSICSQGSYFVQYTRDVWPKERFFQIRMLPADRRADLEEPVPQLVCHVHRGGVDIVKAISLEMLVGVTATPMSTAAFQPFIESSTTILGCRQGRGHRAHLPLDGAFTLWFYDQQQHIADSVSLLTTDAKVFDIWTKTFRGLVSVNSSSVVQAPLSVDGHSMQLVELTRAAQMQDSHR